MEHFIVQINDEHLITCAGNNVDEVKSKALSSHPCAYSVRVIGEVHHIYTLVKPFEIAGMVPKDNKHFGITLI